MNTQACVFIVDDDEAVRDSYAQIMETAGFDYQTYDSAEQFLRDYQPGKDGCLLLDMSMPGLSGLELQSELLHRNIQLPIIFLTAYGSIPVTVSAMKAGAVDFLIKPVPRNQLVEHILNVFQSEAELSEHKATQKAASERLNSLTSREAEILPLMLSGLSNKQVARKLGISYRTVEIHRSRIFMKTGAANLVELDHLYETSCHYDARTPSANAQLRMRINSH